MAVAFYKRNFSCLNIFKHKEPCIVLSFIHLEIKPVSGLLLSLLVVAGLLVTSVAQARVLNQENSESGHFEAEILYQALTAEIYREIGNEIKAVQAYQDLALASNDPSISRQATILAAATGQLSRGLKAAEHWVTLTPDDLEARQYLALLYLRNNQLTLSASQFYSIHGLVERTALKPASMDAEVHNNAGKNESNNNGLSIKTSQGLTFIGAVLAQETHREKAYRAYLEYLKQSKNKNYYQQQQLIAANLAFKAKNYNAVVLELENLKNLDPQNLVDAMAMKAKALHKLNKNVAAIKVLKSIQDNPETSDSSRLELVRLLVLQKRKNEALPILQKLIKKHDKNIDLLKSLIALQIDQGQLINAQDNIQKLRSTKTFTSDADYFSGEVLQAKGDLSKALNFYNKVSAGSFKRNADQKAVLLTRKTQGEKGMTQFFELKQKTTSRPEDKAYWFKSRADYLFEVKNYPQALVFYNKAIALSPLKTQYYYRRGLLHERIRNLQSAENDFNQVLSIRDNDADALNALGYMLTINTKRLDEAKKYLTKAHQIRPDDPVIMDSLGFVYFKQGDYAKAEKYLRRAYSQMKNPEVASHLISVLAENDKLEEAQSIHKDMMNKYPDSTILQNATQYLQN